MIREIEGFTRDDYIEAIRSSLSQQGWDPATAADEADELISLAWDWPVGAVAERRLNRVAVRLVTTPPGCGTPGADRPVVTPSRRARSA